MTSDLNPILQLMRQGQHANALKALDDLISAEPEHAGAQHLRAICLSKLERLEDALGAIDDAVRISPEMVVAWQVKGDLHIRNKQPREALQAFEQVPSLSGDHPFLKRAEELLQQKWRGRATVLYQHFNDLEPQDGRGFEGMARIAGSLGATIDATELYRKALERSPEREQARYEYARLLSARQKYPEALKQVEKLLAIAPKNTAYLLMKAAILDRMSHYAEALEVMQSVEATPVQETRVHTSTGYIQRTMGLNEEAVSSFYHAIQHDPTAGEPWFALANMKNYEFGTSQIDAMQQSLKRSEKDQERCWFHFALGKALEQQEAWSDAFTHYAAGCKLQNQKKPFNSAGHDQALVQWQSAAEHITEPPPANDAADTPIFIIGLPRSGTTLVEQILASHSQVEGLKELPHVATLIKDLNYIQRKAGGEPYPVALLESKAETLAELGQNYLEDTRVLRTSDRRFFTDKMPNNFEHIGLISRMLPNAKFIDVRRQPMANGFSAFRQLFNTGQEWSYRLEDIALYYRNYLAYQALWDEALPGQVFHLQYEQLVQDTENTVRGTLDYLGLNFEPACLEFYSNRRPIKSASSEQVRQPVHDQALNHWKHFEPQLEPLKNAFRQNGVEI